MALLATKLAPAVAAAPRQARCCLPRCRLTGPRVPGSPDSGFTGRMGTVARGLSGVSLPYPTNNQQQASITECLQSVVLVDNEAHPRYTVIKIQAPDTPGLVRVLSWVLNGMSVRVAYGQLETTSEGVAKDTLWVTDFKGNKLKDSSAASLGARLEDFLIVCQATESDEKEWQCGNIEVSNMVSPDMTQVIIRGEPDGTKPGFLLELTTALTSVGASIQEAAIQGGTDVPEPACDVAEPGHDFERQGRVFKFMLKGPTGGQMDADRVASLIFTLRLLEGKGIMPTVAPNMDALLKLQTKCN